MNVLAQLTTCRLAELHPSQHSTARAAGIITNIRTRQTKRGDRIGIFTLDDGSNQIEAVCFSECFQKFRSLLIEDQLIIVEGDISMDDFSNTARIVCRELYTIDEARGRYAKCLKIHLKAAQPLDLLQLKQVFGKFLGGRCPIILRLMKDSVQTDIKLGAEWLIKPTDALLGMIEAQLPVEVTEIVYK
jgi:DNA polymerase-3 subunit alpha